jgi:DNA polymerase-3 subunit gamma/tau
MAKQKASPTDTAAKPGPDQTAYTVLARRYRPQQFADLVGQDAVVKALINALESNRVAHAYLFTGARGVGKTSTARILAKALNCIHGPTTKPCDACEICQSIASGEDVDVVEMDAASNRGIDEIREIRQNVGLRPSRSRYKIYIVDEVHMLTREAFNALLKTLEEPPDHVKFIFATTEVQKIPITILSRCQRFDFAGINAERIAERLRQVVTAEEMEADDEALELIARRAGGSMRDAQSLLDQLLAFAGRLDSEQVHQLLGTAHDERVLALASAVLEQDAAKALELLGQAADEGLQLGEFLDQLMDYWRDLMVVHCAGPEFRYLNLPSRYRETLARQAASLKLDTILAGLDVLATTKARLRGSSHTRALVEQALVRLGRLENLVALSELAERLDQPGIAATSSAGATISSKPSSPDSRSPGAARLPQTPRPAEVLKKKDVVTPEVADPKPLVPLSAETLQEIWREVLNQVGLMLKSELEKAGLPAILGPNTLVLCFPASYNSQREHCQSPARLGKVEEALRKITGKACNVRIESAGGDAALVKPSAEATENTQSRYRRQRAEAIKEPLVKRAMEVLAAQFVDADEGFGSTPSTQTSEVSETSEVCREIEET